MNPVAIAQTLLEGYDYESDEDLRQFLIRTGIIKGYHQIGGDWGGPWIWGGTWYSPWTKELIHFDGIDQQRGGKDTDPYSDKVTGVMTDEDRAKIAQMRQGLDPDERRWDEAEDDVRQEIADRIDSEKKFEVYRVSVGTKPDSWWKVDNILSSYGNPDHDREWWDALPMEHKTQAAAEYHGWHEFDPFPDRYTRKELQELLGKDV